MNKTEFLAQLSILEDVFDKKYHEKIEAMIYGEFGHYSISNFSRLISELVASKKFTPTLKDFREVDIELRNARYYKAKENQTNDIKQNWGPLFNQAETYNAIDQHLKKIVEMIKKIQSESSAIWKKNHITGEYLKNLDHYNQSAALL
jgi:hypothetical protein